MLTPDKAGSSEDKEIIAPIEDGEVGKTQQTDKKGYSPTTQKSIKSVESDAIFIRSYLLAQGYSFPPATVYQDNQAATRLSENGVASSSRTRHIDARYFFTQDRVENGDVKAERLNTKSMVADYLTKPLVGELFYKLRDLLLGYTTL